MQGVKKLSVIAVVLVFAMAITLPVLAQQTSQQGLVTVNISNVANNIAQNLKVNVSQVPVTVQAPVSVAAAVCGIDAAVLTQQVTQGNASCTAKSTSTALDSIVQQQIKK